MSHVLVNDVTNTPCFDQACATKSVETGKIFTLVNRRLKKGNDKNRACEVSRKRRALVTVADGTLPFSIRFSGMRPRAPAGACASWQAVRKHVRGGARVRAHRRRGMRRRTSASFLLRSTTTLRTYIFPGGSPTFATIISVAAAPARERANVSPFSAFLFGVSSLDDYARTPALPRVYTSIFHGWKRHRSVQPCRDELFSAVSREFVGTVRRC